MKLTDYYNLTKFTIRNCLKISGIVFTTIYALMVIVLVIKGVDREPDTAIDPVKVFIFCFLAGNLLGLFITIMGFFAGFKQVKDTIILYNLIPDETREQYGLKLYAQPQNPEYKYLNLQINSTRPETPVLFFSQLRHPHIVQIIVANYFENKKFHLLLHKINKKYRQQQVQVNGKGISKIIKWKKFRKLTSSDIKKCVDELIAISKAEGLDVVFHSPL